jgi:hypothetical protein
MLSFHVRPLLACLASHERRALSQNHRPAARGLHQLLSKGAGHPPPHRLDFAQQCRRLLGFNRGHDDVRFCSQFYASAALIPNGTAEVRGGSGVGPGVRAGWSLPLRAQSFYYISRAHRARRWGAPLPYPCNALAATSCSVLPLMEDQEESQERRSHRRKRFTRRKGGPDVPREQHPPSHPCLVKIANRSCKSEGCWSKSLKRLLLDWNRF